MRKQKTKVRVFVRSSADFMDITASMPRKLLPKMTLLDFPASLSDGEIVFGVHEKNP